MYELTPQGEPIYEGAGFHHNTHIQICVRNSNCILGFFLPRQEIDYQRIAASDYARLLQL